MLSLIGAGRVIGAHAGPPCSTVSRVRHRRIRGAGPRPLRRRSGFWNCIEGRSWREQRACHIGNALMLICMGLLGEVVSKCGWIGLEHPDPGREPFPSLFATSELQALAQYALAVQVSMHQCAFGCQQETHAMVGFTVRAPLPAQTMPSQPCAHSLVRSSAHRGLQNHPGCAISNSPMSSCGAAGD